MPDDERLAEEPTQEQIERHLAAGDHVWMPPRTVEFPDSAVPPQQDARGKFLPGNSIGRQWQPGASANPGGEPGPKAELVRELNAHLRETDDTGVTYARRMTEKLVELAIAGHTEAIKYIEDRIEGKPAQAVTLSLDEGPLHYRLNVVDGGPRARALPPADEPSD